MCFVRPHNESLGGEGVDVFPVDLSVIFFSFCMHHSLDDKRALAMPGVGPSGNLHCKSPPFPLNGGTLLTCPRKKNSGVWFVCAL